MRGGRTPAFLPLKTEQFFFIFPRSYSASYASYLTESSEKAPRSLVDSVAPPASAHLLLRLRPAPPRVRGGQVTVSTFSTRREG